MHVEQRSLYLALIVSLWQGLAISAPVNARAAAEAAQAFVTAHAPALNAMSTMARPPVDAQIARVVALQAGEKACGYVAELSHGGFVLMRTDDRLPAIKLYAPQGVFSNLPPGMQRVLEWELEEEARALAANHPALQEQRERNHAEWQALRTGDAGIYASGAAWLEQPLLYTKWNQNAPYNAAAPDAAGGPDGQAYAGCVAVAMAQIMKHHAFPPALLRDVRYGDMEGRCQAAHRVSTAGSAPYAWEQMPDALTPTSSTVAIAETARLLYHCGVSVRMDYEADGSGAYSQHVPRALRRQFGYACSDLRMRGNYFDHQWYDMLAWDIQNSRPVLYGFYNSRGEGHAVVCDGVRGGNQLHINMGWSGCEDAWYFMNGIGDWQQYHHAVLDIRPARVTQAPAAPRIVIASNDEYARIVALTWEAASHATRYQVWRSTTNDGTTARLLGETPYPSFLDARVNDGETYYYWVRAGNAAGMSGLSGATVGRAHDMAGSAFAPPLTRNVRARARGYSLTSPLRMTWEELRACVAQGYTAYELRFTDGTVQRVNLQPNANGTAFAGTLDGAAPTHVAIRATRKGLMLTVRNWHDQDLHWARHALAARVL